jgi:hypothetical protein
MKPALPGGEGKTLFQRLQRGLLWIFKDFSG